jgi:hypothetical protein
MAHLSPNPRSHSPHIKAPRGGLRAGGEGEASGDLKGCGRGLGANAHIAETANSQEVCFRSY